MHSKELQDFREFGKKIESEKAGGYSWYTQRFAWNSNLNEVKKESMFQIY